MAQSGRRNGITGMGKAAALAALLVLGVLPALAEDGFTASNGAVLGAPPLDIMTCAQMKALLNTCTESGYRGFGPVPTSHPDRPVFEYETRLAARHYDTCQRGALHVRDAASAFSRGFR